MITWVLILHVIVGVPGQIQAYFVTQTECVTEATRINDSLWEHPATSRYWASCESAFIK
jgi:hypothetical protein